MAMNDLRDVMVDLTKDLYHAEKQLIAALPKMARAASSPELRSAFEEHLEETRTHIERLDQVFAVLEMKPMAKICHGMKGLVEEGKEVIEERREGSPAAVDAALIAAAQKVEHYEITAYGTLVSFAETLGLQEAVELLKESLAEEEAADEKLTELAEGSINQEAAAAEGDEEEDVPATQRRPSKTGKAKSRR